MAPLTRNQQAALQAHPQASNSSSLSSRLRGGSGQEDAPSRSLDSVLRRTEASSRNHDQLHHDINSEKLPGSPHDPQPNLHHYGNLHSLNSFGSPSSVAETGDASSRLNSDLNSALEQNVLLRGTTDWTSFANNSSMTDELYQDSTGPTSHHTSPFYTMQESSQREQDAVNAQQAGFIDNFGGMHHNGNSHSLLAWKHQEESRRHSQGRGSIDLTSPFTNPASFKLHEHSRSFSNDGLAMATKRLEAAQTSGTLAMDLQRLGSMHLPPSPTDTLATQEGMRTFHQHTQSMGQAGREMNEGLLRDGLLRLNNGAAVIEGNLMDQFGVKRRILSQSSSSLRSPSPSDRSVSSTAMFGNMSPHASISTMRHGGDSSVDTSIDSISNSVTSMSTNPSRSSSTSDGIMEIRKNIKGKTRLRNIDRKLICEAARDDPKVRQEDLALRFGIERSTVSKTLKNKDKWLVIQEESEGAMIIKHRSGKFPELESTLAKWAKSQAAKGHAVLDVALRHRALEIAKEAGLGVDTFKASVGWIEKFRDRHDLSKTTSSSSLLSSMRSDRKTTESQPSPSSSHAAEAGDVEMNNHFTPRDSTLRSQTSSSSMSNEESGPATTQETPKAAKRHYDDMNTSLPISSSIDSSMASLHFIQRVSQEGPLNLDQEMTSPSSGTSKRRKAGREVSSLPSQQSISSADGSRSWSIATRRKGSDVQINNNICGTDASAQVDGMSSALSRMEQQPIAYRSYGPVVTSSNNNNTGSRREVASPTQQSPSLEQMTESNSTTPFTLAGFHEDRRVSLQEARESLDLVLAFIARQPANLSPSDYFVLGNLQGTLSALAGQIQSQNQQPQSQLQSPLQRSTTDISSHEVYQDDEQQQSRRLRL